MNKLWKLTTIAVVSSTSLILVNLFPFANSAVQVMSLYFIMILGIGIAFALRPSVPDKTEKDVFIFRRDGMLQMVNRAADGDKDARNFIANSLQLKDSDEELKALDEYNNFAILAQGKKFPGLKKKKERNQYLATLERLLDRIIDERYY